MSSEHAPAKTVAGRIVQISGCFRCTRNFRGARCCGRALSVDTGVHQVINRPLVCSRSKILTNIFQDIIENFQIEK